MKRIWAACVLLWVMAGIAAAQPLGGLARALSEGSGITDQSHGAEVTLELSQGVPYRVFALEKPRRLVVDFAEVDFSGLAPDQFLADPGRVKAVRFGGFKPGWSRMVLDLAQPLLPAQIEMQINPASGAGTLNIVLQDSSESDFAAQAGAPDGAFGLALTSTPRSARPRDQFTVVLDPGHGGVDPGAERDGLVEKTLVLEFARRVQDALRRAGLAVEMTRTKDQFVSLEGRTAFAHQAGASVFVSIHADALSQGGARGATVYTLSDEASDAASALLAERHNRSDILAGIDLTGADDEVTGVLLDLARRETEPRSALLARAVISGMDAAGGPMNRKPWRKAGFSVLKSADIPSVLVEIGFLSDARDRKNLADPAWRARQAQALATAILAWRDADAARKALVRQ
ncbi:MAG: N-acetylmuramoyl-L-alanine amidase [Paracoccaceae bacterium]